MMLFTFVEPGLATVETGKVIQFIRKGCFCLDKTSTTDKLVFNRTVTLKDGWVKK